MAQPFAQGGLFRRISRFRRSRPSGGVRLAVFRQMQKFRQQRACKSPLRGVGIAAAVQAKHAAQGVQIAAPELQTVRQFGPDPRFGPHGRRQ